LADAGQIVSKKVKNSASSKLLIFYALIRMLFLEKEQEKFLQIVIQPKFL
jgi:hypothetical protein